MITWETSTLKQLEAYSVFALDFAEEYPSRTCTNCSQYLFKVREAKSFRVSNFINLVIDRKVICARNAYLKMRPCSSRSKFRAFGNYIKCKKVLSLSESNTFGIRDINLKPLT